MIYTGIGSRKTPQQVLAMMTRIAKRLADLGFTLRSGGASGADTAFHQGACAGNGTFEIYLPWPNFQGLQGVGIIDSPAKEAYQIAERFHPKWSVLRSSVQALHARNVHQVLGMDLKTPSMLVICWTPDGAETLEETSIETGGTGTAIRIASSYGVPVVNMARPGYLERIAEIIKNR